MAAPTLVVDLSHWNPTPDWRALKAGGIVGVILKATEGQTYVDKTFHGRSRAARDAGLAVSSYHFLHKGSIEAQMAHYLAAVQPRPGERLCIDHEKDASLAELERAVQFLRDRAPDCQLTIYSGHLIKEQLGSKKSAILAENTSLWIAHYTTASAPTWPKETWPAWSLWQFTDKANVAGISKPVDGNRFNGNAASAIRWLGPAVQEPVDPVEPQLPEPTPEAKVVIVSVQASPGVGVQVVVNGEVIRS